MKVTRERANLQDKRGQSSYTINSVEMVGGMYFVSQEYAVCWALRKVVLGVVDLLAFPLPCGLVDVCIIGERACLMLERACLMWEWRLCLALHIHRNVLCDSKYAQITCEIACTRLPKRLSRHTVQAGPRVFAHAQFVLAVCRRVTFNLVGCLFHSCLVLKCCICCRAEGRGDPHRSNQEEVQGV